MRTTTHPFRVITVTALVCLLNMLVFSSLLTAQERDCPYDKADPSLDNARISFKSLDYECAEQEIEDFLKKDNITIEERADAHVLLAAVYYARSKDHNEKRELVVEQFKQAFRAYRNWRGELDISSTEFIEMMNAAKVLVDEEGEEKPEPVKPAVEKPAPPPPTPTTTPTTTIATTTGKSKPWYKQWWAYVIGVGIVAGAAVALSGGGGDDGGGGVTPADTLPNFPPPPPN